MAKALTVASIEKLKPSGQRREIADAHMPGLYLIVQPSGSKSWAVRYRLAGASRKFTIGPYPGFSLTDARDAAGAALRAAARGEDPGLSRREARAAELHKLGLLKEAKRDSFAAIAEQFVMARRKSPRNRSWRETARLLGIRAKEQTGGPIHLELITGGIAKRWSDRNIASITKRDVREAVEGIADNDKGPLANRTFSAIRRLFNWAVQRDIVATSPCDGLEPPASEGSRTRILNDDEIRWLWLAAGEQSYPFGHLAKLLLLTGQRRTEVAGIVADELNRQSRQWLIPRERTKNARANLVPLSDAALEILQSTPSRGFLLTQTKITPISGFSRAKRQLDKLMFEIARSEAADRSEVKIEGWTYHDLRRTAASGMAKLRVAPHVIEAVLNHASGVISGVAATYNVYQYADEKREALDRWAQHIARVTGPPPHLG
ncbi:site-specific integrase [Hyphomicrobium sp. 99]|uniref:tyrosine-type recombinase/integrase n=1 Tax=Hyphomicrobium sp. 99 TaxID=1163419 RepID=UPI0005F79CB4|nr:site-specific integrase [Hyphomicrobium sp. 99]